ncbi:hypothetical protein ACWFNS_00050 [Oerskovia enterophila]
MSDEARDALLDALVIWAWKDHTQGQDVVEAARAAGGRRVRVARCG